MLIFQTFYGNVMPEISKLYCFLEKNALEIAIQKISCNFLHSSFIKISCLVVSFDRHEGRIHHYRILRNEKNGNFYMQVSRRQSVQ